MTSDGSRANLAPVSIPTVSVPGHPVWPQLSNEEELHLKEKIKDLLIQVNGVLVAHYYTDGRLQDLADETGGCVADSLEMARFGAESSARTLVVCGVRFMGETAKIGYMPTRVWGTPTTAMCRAFSSGNRTAIPASAAARCRTAGPSTWRRAPA